jgi:hypothetical protein
MNQSIPEDTCIRISFKGKERNSSTPNHILQSLESRCAATHHFTLANQFCVEFGSVKGEVDVEIHTIECSLRGIHSFKVLLEILPGQIRGECNDFLDSYTIVSKKYSFENLRRLTGIFGIFGANIIITRIQDILVHQCCTRSYLSEERNLHRLANLHSLALLHEDLSSELASVLAVQ